MPKYKQKLLFASFKIWIIALSLLFLQHWRLFFIDWRYSFSDTGKTLYLPPLKLGLRHNPYYFYNIGGYFASIGEMFAKIRAKSFIHRLWNLFYVIVCSIFRTLEIISLVDWKYGFQDLGKIFFLSVLKLGLLHYSF